MMKYSKLNVTLSLVGILCFSAFSASNSIRDRLKTSDMALLHGKPLYIKNAMRSDLDSFVPVGYRVMEIFHSDLNLDSIPDVALLLGVDPNADSTILDTMVVVGNDYIQRPFLILIRHLDSSLHLTARNDELFSGVVVGMYQSIYYPGIYVRDGEFGYEGFYVHSSMGHSESTVRFKYSKLKNGWYLKEHVYQNISDTPLEDGDYGDTTGSFHHTEKDFGEVDFRGFPYNY